MTKSRCPECNRDDLIIGPIRLIPGIKTIIRFESTYFICKNPVCIHRWISIPTEDDQHRYIDDKWFQINPLPYL